MTEAQELIAPTDTVMAVVGDTVVSAGQDSVLALDSVPKKQTGLDAPVSYQAKDSIIMFPVRKSNKIIRHLYFKNIPSLFAVCYSGQMYNNLASQSLFFP